MTMLLILRRFGSMKLLKRFLPMLLVAIFIVLSFMPNTAMAEPQKKMNDMWAGKDLVESESTDCGTQSVSENGFTPCNYVAGGVVMSQVDPEKEAGGFYTPSDGKSDRSMGYNLIAGRHFKPHWFGELSYTDMGEATLKNRNPNIDDESISYKVPSAHLGYLFRAPEKQLNFYVKGGLSAIQNKASSSTVPYKKQTSVQKTFGIGTQWQAKDSGMFVRLGADFFDRDAIAASLNIGYKFGGEKRRVRKVVKPVPVYRPAPKPVRVVKKPIVRKVVKAPVKRVVKKAVRYQRPVAPVACQLGVLKGVNFHTDSAQLTKSAQSVLATVSQRLKRCTTPKLVLVGHTDNVGSRAYNKALSQRRVNTVKTYLVRHGVAARRLTAIGKGEAQPRASNKTNQGRAANRRVELLAQ